MLAGLIYGFGWGDFWEDGGELMDNPWEIVSLVDVYVGFFLFLGWVWIREDLLLAKLLWAVAILVGGNLFACLYALFALGQSREARSILLGKQGSNSPVSNSNYAQKKPA